MPISESESKPPSGPALDEPRPGATVPRRWRIRLWQAIAGMCAAITIAMSIVNAELARSLASRTNYMNRRIAALNATVRDLKRQTSAAKRKLGAEEERVSANAEFEKIFVASDLRTIRLGAPGEKNKAGVTADGAAIPTGRLAISQSAGAAMLEVSGLKPSGNFQVYRVWWMPKRGGPVLAADFLVGEDGAARVALELPPPLLKDPSVTVTLEDEAYGELPVGPVALRGDPTRAESKASILRKSKRQ
ncbi:MAG TPA: anti-sigma factor [Candidatus Acidoferrales bacterium]|nr:anti-sigma factor [Candidatus Acidoferrales bacterium]